MFNEDTKLRTWTGRESRELRKHVLEGKKIGKEIPPDKGVMHKLSPRVVGTYSLLLTASGVI